MRRVAVCSLAALTLVACGGPKVPLDIAGKSVPIDVAFQDKRDLPTAEAPVPVEDNASVQVVPTEGGFVVVPREIPPTPLERFPTPPKPVLNRPCADPSPFAFPAREATPTVDGPAPAGKYRFRTDGTFDITILAGRYAPVEERQVGNVVQSGTTRRFDVTENRADAAQVSTFQSSDTEVALAQVTSVVRRTVTSPPTTVTFSPVPPVRLLPLPPRQNDALGQPVTTWTSVGADPRTTAVMTVNGRIIGKDRVNACGEVIDTWLAELDVRYVAPDDSYTGLWRINVATGYGGLIVAESVNFQGTRFGLPYKSQRTSAINEVPT